MKRLANIYRALTVLLGVCEDHADSASDGERLHFVAYFPMKLLSPVAIVAFAHLAMN